MTPKKTLLVLTSTYPRWPGDPEPGFVHELSKRLTAQFRVIVLAPHAPDAAAREVIEGVEVVRYRYAPGRWETLVNDGGIITNLKQHRWKLLLVPGFVLMQAWQTWRLCRQESVDIIHAHWLIPQGLMAALLRWLPGRKVPFIVTSHGADLYALKGRLLNALKRFVLRRATAVTVVSTAMRRALQDIDTDVEHISVMPMGVDMRNRFTPDVSVARSKDAILFVGRLVEKKGVAHLIRAMPAVLKQRPSAFLTIVGFGPEENRLRRLVHDLQLNEKVRFLGAQKQDALPTLYRQAALFVAPFVQASSGDEEGLGLVLLEATGCGCPVLAGNVPAVNEIFGDVTEQMTCDPRNAAVLSSRILDVLKDPDSAQGMALRLGETIRRRFDWEQVVINYSELLTAISSK